MIKLNLQLFADAGTLVNATSTYINASTGATTAFDGTNTLTSTMKTFYDTLMLENARDNLVFAQLGRKQALPKNAGKITEWRKWNTLPDAETLTEGVIPTGQKFGQSYQNVTITQHGIYTTISDQLELHALDKVIVGATEEIGASVGRTYDKLVRTALLLGTNTLYADAVKTDDGTYSYVSTPTSRYGLSSAAATMCLLTPDMIAKAVTDLEQNNAKYYDGSNYVAVIHPSVAYNLRKHPDWEDYHKYAAVTELFNGELGMLHGVRFLKSTLAPVIRGDDLTAASRTLTVKDTVTNATFGTDEAITTAEATALAGRTIIVNGVQHTIVSAAAGAAGSATITTSASATFTNEHVVYPGEGGALGVSIYVTMFFGKDAFDVVDPEGAGIETIIHSKDEIGGPLNQFSTVGSKFSMAAKILYPERMVSVESVSSYSATDAEN